MKAAPRKERLDRLLVERGLVDSRTRAQALIMAGGVVVGEARVDKAGALVDREAPIRLKEGALPLRYVSRGALKLLRALEVFPVDPKGKVCVDLGASTGGFTQVLLERGARKVHAVDVGYGQLHEKLRGDPRIELWERTNARLITRETLGERAELVVGDLSFISLTLILPVVWELLVASGEAVLLVKPQFEVGKGEVGKGGVVREEEKRTGALLKVKRAAGALGFSFLGEAESPILGPAGNKEYLLWLRKG